jgi:hypothetical protein
MKIKFANTCLGKCGDNWIKKMVKLVSFCLKSQADMMFHMCECCSQQAGEITAVLLPMKITWTGKAGASSLLQSM